MSSRTPRYTVRSLRWIGLISILAAVWSCEPSYDPRLYFPLHENNTYYFSGPLYVVKVAGTNDVRGSTVWAVHYIDSTGRIYLAEEYVQDPGRGALWKSFAAINLPKIVFDPPIPFAPPDTEVGASDTLTGMEVWGESMRFRIKTVRTVEAIEDVSAPAGTFNDCVRVRVDHLYLDQPPVRVFGTSRFWFAKGIGFVKYEFVESGMTGELEKARLADSSYPK